uniref:Kazal-like domain-containing protein n=1 Tax=Knipowitschia caucasica TaxID=637954 RepID=A0AAV2LNX9_KNICA
MESTVQQEQSNRSSPTGAVQQEQSNRSSPTGAVQQEQSNRSSPTGAVQQEQSNRSSPTGAVQQEQSNRSSPTGAVQQEQSNRSSPTGAVQQEQSNRSSPTGAVQQEQSNRSSPTGAVQQEQSNRSSPTGAVQQEQSQQEQSNRSSPTGAVQQEQSNRSSPTGAQSNRSSPTGAVQQEQSNRSSPTGAVQQEQSQHEQSNRSSPTGAVQQEQSNRSSILFSTLVFGPACGFILGSVCTKVYVDAVFIDTSTLDITPDDPRWIGAWWAGFLLCSALLFLSALFMFGFPQTLDEQDSGGESEQAMLPSALTLDRPKGTTHGCDVNSGLSVCQHLRVIPRVTRHLLSNPVFSCIALAACMEIAVVAGFAAFLGKYLEQQFNLTTSSANQLLGMTAIPCACLGIFLGGLLVKKLNLSALGAVRMAMLVNLISTACYVSFLFLGCDTGPVAGVTIAYVNETLHSWQRPESACISNCNCYTASVSPVCGSNGVTYLSACFAGCTQRNLTSCMCVSGSSEDAVALPGKCPSPGCQQAFLTFLSIICVCSMIGAMAQTPSVIILIRTVSPELKSYALGVLFLLLRLIGFIPPPLIFGMGIDSTCLFWSSVCGEKGACMLYDNVSYRHLYVSIAIVLKSSAFLLYATTWQCLRKNYRKYIKNSEGYLTPTELFSSNVTLDNLGKDMAIDPNNRTKYIYNLEDHESTPGYPRPPPGLPSASPQPPLSLLSASPQPPLCLPSPQPPLCLPPASPLPPLSLSSASPQPPVSLSSASPLPPLPSASPQPPLCLPSASPPLSLSSASPQPPLSLPSASPLPPLNLPSASPLPPLCLPSASPLPPLPSASPLPPLTSPSPLPPLSLPSASSLPPLSLPSASPHLTLPSASPLPPLPSASPLPPLSPPSPSPLPPLTSPSPLPPLPSASPLPPLTSPSPLPPLSLPSASPQPPLSLPSASPLPPLCLPSASPLPPLCLPSASPLPPLCLPSASPLPPLPPQPLLCLPSPQPPLCLPSASPPLSLSSASPQPPLSLPSAPPLPPLCPPLSLHCR